MLEQIKGIKLKGANFVSQTELNLFKSSNDKVAKLALVYGRNGSGDSDIMMTDTINPLKSKFKGFHKTFKQDDLGLSLSSFLLN
ncbi:MAG: hypothetical protein KHZ80_08080 [Anaerococcus vaginalis]|uniref:hypothetical protein n=1 Tax=Anaerococcus vaginalis TaxID=33037 RepID=UPI001D62B03A|nr:hypothetical protein [Anaerococcus vaginalis]MBS4889975.1 hypothetical protein [Anaerococcus vaginalis]